MSDERNDGGPAFAALGAAPSGDVYHQTGMSLRDWFAGHVMVALIIANEGSLDSIGLGNAKDAYYAADAMLKARSAP